MAANSGIAWIDFIFDWSVIGLFELAYLLGMSYEEINVWLFCVAYPLVLLVSLGLNVYLIRRYRRNAV